jgi:hypothetical protein
VCNLHYIAVSQDDNGLVNRYYKNVLYNPVRQNFDTLLKYKRYENSVNFADSGGFQIANSEGSDEKPCLVKIGAGIQIKKDLTIIDPIDLCRQYGKLDIRYGFTLDHPFWDNTDPKNFLKRLNDSFTWAKLMFAERTRKCPRTEFIIPLHFVTKTQLETYFKKMSQLNPEGYAIPAFKKRNLNDIIKISYTLSFLHHKNVNKVHLLGTSNRVVIAIMAAALILKMFEMISFDSRTWNNATNKFRKDKSSENEDYFYINPLTLGKQNIIPGETKIIHFLPPRLKGLIEFDPSEAFRSAKEKIYLFNAFATRRYAKRLAEKANDLPGLFDYLPEAGFGDSELKKASEGTQILMDSIKYGFVNVRKNVTWK